MIEGTLFIISAPSGGGKTSLVNALLKKIPNLELSVSHTTRLARPNEQDGKDYFFVDLPTFEQLRQKNVFLEHAQVFNHFYGTSKEWVVLQLKQGKDVILEIDWQGARRIKSLMPCVGIFILPPSQSQLLERLKARRQDSDDIIRARMAQASDEIRHYDEYDYVVVNDAFDEALTDLEAIVRANRLKTARQQQAQYACLQSFF